MKLQKQFIIDSNAYQANQLQNAMAEKFFILESYNLAYFEVVN
jgi:hypothetical protein